jgi:hypothetical protein
MKIKDVCFVLVFITILFFFSEVNGQSESFSFTYASSHDEMPVAACELNNGTYIISARKGPYEPGNFQYQLLLLKLNTSGDTVLSGVIAVPDGSCYINTLIADTGNCFFGIGSSRQTSMETSVWVFKMTENFEIIWERFYKTNCEWLGSVQGFKDSFDNLIIYGDGYTGSTTSDDLFIYKVSVTGDSLSFIFYPDPASETAWSMTENPNICQYYLTISGRYQVNTNSMGQILTIAYDLNINKIDSLPGRLYLYHNSMMIADNLLLSGIRVIAQSPHALNLIGIEKVDTSFMVINANALGSMDPDTLSYPGYFNNLDTSSSSTLFFGGTFHQDNYLIFSSFNSWILLGRLDTSLNLLWQKFYGGDKYYGLWGLVATSDGGCLLLGSTYDDQVQYNQRDIIIIKVDSNGVLTGGVNKLDTRAHDVIVYPTPGTDYLIIQSGPQISGADFCMVDMQGRNVLQTKLDQPRCRISTVHLSSGTYAWTITHRNRIIETGKWMLVR